MRKFRCSPFGEEVDLDDPETYKHLPDDIRELDSLMLKEIGYYYCYTRFWHSDVFMDGNNDGGQVNRVEKLIKEFTDNRSDNWENIMWFKEQVFLFKDEIENMC